MGLPFGDSAVRDPVQEVRERQLHWLQLVVNLPGLVGEVHRMVAWAGDEWVEPCRAFRAALQAVGWTVRRNRACLRAVGWPVVAAEASYPGEVRLVPEDCFPEEGAGFTDGSVSGCGGAAAVEPSGEVVRAVRVLSPRSSTHCELVALALALALEPPPLQVLSDSLVSLRLLERWGTYPARRVLGCQDRMEVRPVVHAAECLASPPLLMKVKAHDVGACGSSTRWPWEMMRPISGCGRRLRAVERSQSTGFSSWYNSSIHGRARA